MIIDRLLDAHERFADRPFLVTDSGVTTYEEAWRRILATAAWIEEVDAESSLVGVMAERGPGAYVGTLAALAAGRGFVSMTPKMPPERLRLIAAAARLKSVILGPCQIDAFATIFRDWPHRVTGIIGAGAAARTVSADPADLPTGLRIIDAASPGREAPRRRRPSDSGALLYLLFTSGTTGVPKGVPISNSNAAAYLDFVVPRYRYGPQDRHSQTFELSFDLSVHDLMTAWTTGGALVPLTGAGLFAPARTVERHGITCWFSVPSQGALMERARALRPGSMPGLRVSLFCGEALPASIATAWAAAAPNSRIENLYGPTEATIAITFHPFNRQVGGAALRRGIVPIGRPFDGQAAALINHDGGAPIEGVGSGELLLGGSQLSSGYWKAPETSAEKFQSFAWAPGTRWYKTGDLVERDEHGVLHFVGRLDHQIKFRGHRIELAEVEEVLRREAETPLVVALAHPVVDGECRGLVAVVAKTKLAGQDILAGARRHLPAYMVPGSIKLVDDLPRNTSGKIDRSAILRMLNSTQ